MTSASSVSLSSAQTNLRSDIERAIAHLRDLSQYDIQHQWRWCFDDLSIDQVLAEGAEAEWAIAPLNARQHIAWPRGRQALWLKQSIQVPQDCHGFALDGLTLRLALTWWAEDAQIFVDGERVHTGDLYDCFCRLFLRDAVIPGEVITVAIRLVSPGHDDGALVRSRCLYETPAQSLHPVPEPGFVADELEVLYQYLQAFDEEQLSTLHHALQAIAWDTLPDNQGFQASLITLREELISFSGALKQRKIHLLGHAHLDLAWLWPIPETWDAAQRTFESVLTLQQAFPALTFTHSTPALYAWLETHRPDLLAAIQAQVQSGTWEVGAGLWVEPELNLVSGESIVRQVVYGQRYTHQQFGHISRIAWLPDTFGFCWQLPQILKLGGMEYFATQKLRWNDSNTFPHEVFDWRSPDGTTIRSLTLPPIGSDIDPVAMARYACSWEVNTGYQECLWLPGAGDHGGGPTRDMLTVAQRWERSPFFPSLQFNTAERFLDHLLDNSDNSLFSSSLASSSSSPSLSPSPLPSPASLPLWNDELYLELHRGCYTTHADQKRWNRRCEVLLYQAELFSSIATLVAGAEYPKQAIEHAWKQVLFNQFHDILPGSSIPEVYDDANPLWREAESTADRLLAAALGAIAQRIQRPASSPDPEQRYPFVVFNPLTWARSELVRVAIPEGADPDKLWVVVDSQGNRQPTQLISEGEPPQETGLKRLAFLSTDVPGIGYRVFALEQVENSSISPSIDRSPSNQPPWSLENDYLHVTIHPQTGEIAALVDKHRQYDVFSGAGNQLQFFRDEGQYWDAWNIAPDYEAHRLPQATLRSIEWIERGALEQRLRVTQTFGQSWLQQDYVLQAGSPVLRVESVVDWHEDYTLLKVAFPVAFTVATATYEMPCGAIGRSPTPITPEEQAKWEVPALNWADVSNGETGTAAYGVSLLSDYKHGYDVTDSHIRLTLLKSPKWPDPNADRGRHVFAYGIYPHAGDWQAARTTHLGYGFNQPLMPHLMPHPVPKSESAPQAVADDARTKPAQTSRGRLSSVGQFLTLPSENLFPMSFKQSEEDSNRWILRFYEGHGTPTEFTPECLGHPLSDADTDLQIDGVLNLLEEETDQRDIGNGWAIAPWKIMTVAFRSRPT
jgi:alpha-mannosidase